MRPPPHELDRNDLSAVYFVLQSRGQLVDVGGGDVYWHAFEHRDAAAADHIATDLDHESLHDIRVELLGGKPNEITESISDGHWRALGSSTGHRFKGIGNAVDANGQRDFLLCESVGIS